MINLPAWLTKYLIAALVVVAWTGGAVAYGYHWRSDVADRELKAVQAEVREQIIEKQRKSMDLEAALLAKAAASTQVSRLRAEQRRGGDVVYAKAGGCAVPVRFVSVWNSASQGTLADPASLADAGPSGVGLIDIEEQHEQDAQAYRTCLDVVRGWQQFWREVAAPQ